MIKRYFSMPLKINRNVAVITILSTLILIVDLYRRLLWSKTADHVLLYLVVPLAVILLIFRHKPARYGFSFGDWRTGIVITLTACLLIAPVLYFVTKADPNMTAYYQGGISPSLPLLTFLDLIGWEFFFRGWILFGYAEEFGDNALWLQAVPFALAHIGKPEIETLSCIFGGFAFGLIAYKTKSFLYAFLVHWFVNTFVVLVAAGVIG